MQSGRNSFLMLAFLVFTVFSPRLRGAPIDPKMTSIPIMFEENMGQAPSRYRFLSRHGTIEALFSDTGADLLLQDKSMGRTAVGFRVLGGRPRVVPEGRDLLPSTSNYLLGADPLHWIHAVPNHFKVIYPAIYPGIDLVFHGNANQMEHDFRIAAHADPDQVRFSIKGAHRITLDSSGNLQISLTDGQLVFKKPTAYQESSRGRKAVASNFVLNPDETVQFRLGSYDRNHELVIDPVFSFSTYLAGSNSDTTAAVTTDSSGNIYVTGFTQSSDFPIVNGVQPKLVGTESAFVSKLDPTGHTLLYSTYLGGSSANYAAAIALDSKGNIIVAGISSSNNFPHAGAVPALTCPNTAACYFIASLTPDGSAFNYSGLIGGAANLGYTDYENQGRLTVDGAGNAYLADVTDDPNFDITPGTLAGTVPGYPYDSTFVLKVDPTGALVYSTIVPGNAPQNAGSLNNIFFPTGISVVSNGQATIAGTAGLGLPTTAGVIAPTFPNDPNVEDASAGFVLQLNATASAINYATYVPGTDLIGGLAVDSMGNSFLTGETSETTLPVSSNAYQKTIKPGPTCVCNSGFLLELDGAGQNVLAATYLEGTPPLGNDGANFSGIALDSHSNVYVGGWNGSSDFPLQNPFVSVLEYTESSSEMVLAGVNSDMSTLLFGSFLSSTDQTPAGSTFSGLAVDYQDNLIITGGTQATDFPTTSGAFQTVPPAQGNHPFVAKLNMAVAAPSVCLDTWTVNFGQVLVGTSITETVHLTNCGNAALNLASLVSSAPTVTASETCGAIQPGIVCPVSLTFSPTETSTVVGTVTLNDNAAISPQIIGFSGQGVASQNFSLSSNPISATITDGQSGTFTLTVAPQGTFTGTINLSCSGLPTLAGCTFNPASLTPDSSSTNSTLTITTTAPAASLARPPFGRRSSPMYGMWLVLPAFLLGTVVVAAPKGRKLLSYCLLFLLVSGCLLQVACSNGGNGGGGGGGGTPPGTYSVIVTGAAGSTQHTITVTLTVS